MRTRRETVVFKHPFRIVGVDHVVVPSAYALVTDEELIEGLSFPAFRRVSTTITIPARPPNSSAMETVTTSARDLAESQSADDLPHD